MHSKRAGDHGALWAKSKNFQGLVFIPNMGKLLLDLKTARKNTNQCLGGLRMEDQGIQSPQIFQAKNVFFLQLPQKHDDLSTFT